MGFSLIASVFFFFLRNRRSWDKWVFCGVVFLCFWGKGKNVERSGCVKVSYTVALKLPLPHFRFVSVGELVSIVFIVIYVFVPLLKINDMGKKYLVKFSHKKNR